MQPAAASSRLFATMPTRETGSRVLTSRLVLGSQVLASSRGAGRTPGCPSAPVIGDGVIAGARQAQRRRRVGRPRSITRACTAGSRTSPPFPTSARPASNCGFTSGPDVRARTQAAAAARAGCAQRDERHVDGDEVEQCGRSQEAVRGQRPRVQPLDDDHARVVPQPPVELTVTDVERHHARAPRCSSTSVNPPVEAPMSSA